MRLLLIVPATIVLIGGLAGILVYRDRHNVHGQGGSVVMDRKPDDTASRRKPTLYCDFYNVMHNATVVSFYFSVNIASPNDAKVSELFVVEPDGTKTDFGNDVPVPHWTYHLEDGAPVITSPDSATTIVLYGFKPQTNGTFWVEAGIRSNDYRNLEGKCRQDDFGSVARLDGAHP